MNEQIKKLYDKAWAETTDHYGTMQKFAELIVKECAVVARAHTLGKYHGFVSDISEYNGIVYVEEAIKQHFGVEYWKKQ